VEYQGPAIRRWFGRLGRPGRFRRRAQGLISF